MSLVAALLALPKLVDSIDRLGQTLDRIEKAKIDKKFDELQEKVSEIAIKIENETTNEGRRALVVELNSIINS